MRLKNFLNEYKKSPLAVFGLILLILIFLIAIFGPMFTRYTYYEQDLSNTFAPPGGEHIMGTDKFGRDVFTRVVYGSRISLKIGFISMLISLIIGTVLGAVSGYFQGIYDGIIMRIMDIFLSIPGLVLAIALATALGNGMGNLILAVSLSSAPRYAKIVRGQVLSIKNREFVESAKVLGASDLRLLFVHILPNTLAPIIVEATIGVGTSILQAAGLSFIGLGIMPPLPEWGQMLSEGREYIRSYPYLTLFPGLAIAITILTMNIVGDGLRDALDPKSRR